MFKQIFVILTFVVATNQQALHAPRERVKKHLSRTTMYHSWPDLRPPDSLPSPNYLYSTLLTSPQSFGPLGITQHNTVAISQNKQFIAVLQRYNSILLFEAQHGDKRTTFVQTAKFLPEITHAFSLGHTCSAHMMRETLLAGAIAFSPDGKFLVVGSRKRLTCAGENENGPIVAVYATNLLKLVHIFSNTHNAPQVGHHDDITCIAFSQDGEIIASGSADHTVKIWAWKSEHRQLLCTVSGFSGPVNAVTFSPWPTDDGKLLVAACDRHSIKIFDWLTAEVVANIDVTEINPTTLAFSPNGKMLAVGGKTLKIFDVITGQRSTNLGIQRQINSVSFSQDGANLFAATSDGILETWDLRDTTFINAVLKHCSSHKQCSSAAISPDAKLVALAIGDEVVVAEKQETL